MTTSLVRCKICPGLCGMLCRPRDSLYMIWPSPAASCLQPSRRIALVSSTTRSCVSHSTWLCKNVQHLVMTFCALMVTMYMLHRYQVDTVRTVISNCIGTFTQELEQELMRRTALLCARRRDCVSYTWTLQCSFFSGLL